MSEKQAFHAFIDLIQFDTTLRNYQTDLHSCDNQILILRQNKDALLRILENIKSTIRELRKEVDLQELNLKTLDTHEQSKRGALDSSNDYKSFKAFRSELDTIHHDRSAQEDRVVQAWDELEAAQERLHKEQPILESDMDALDRAIAEKQAEKDRIVKQKEEFAKGRFQKLAAVPEEWIAKYDIMQSRVEDPVVPVESNSCSVCFYQLIGNDMLQVKQGKLMQCKSCYRLLYLPEVMGCE